MKKILFFLLISCFSQH